MWPHLFSGTLKTCTHFLTVPAEWGISPLWSLGGIKPSCNTPQGHNTSYTQPAPLAHTATPLIQLFLISKTQKDHSYFLFLTLRVAHPQGDRTRVAHLSPCWLREQERQTANCGKEGLQQWGDQHIWFIE